MWKGLVGFISRISLPRRDSNNIAVAPCALDADDRANRSPAFEAWLAGYRRRLDEACAHSHAMTIQAGNLTLEAEAGQHYAQKKAS
jgi:hypothetical protein